MCSVLGSRLFPDAGAAPNDQKVVDRCQGAHILAGERTSGIPAFQRMHDTADDAKLATSVGRGKKPNVLGVLSLSL
jgi:hypothetical protein